MNPVYVVAIDRDSVYDLCAKKDSCDAETAAERGTDNPSE